jgi:mono/diheme cytochrome c family protein
VAHLAIASLSTAFVASADTDAVRIERGAALYGDYCAACHGDGLRATAGGLTFDLRRLRADDRARFLNSVLNGKNQMPPWRGALEPEQIDAIWTYIRATVDR